MIDFIHPVPENTRANVSIMLAHRLRIIPTLVLTTRHMQGSGLMWLVTIYCAEMSPSRLPNDAVRIQSRYAVLGDCDLSSHSHTLSGSGKIDGSHE